MVSKFDASGGYFLCTEAESSGTITELFQVDPHTGALAARGALPSQADGTMPLGFDASGKHILAYRISATQNAYSEQVLVFDFNAMQGTVAFDNSALTTPPHSSDANPLVLSGELLFSRNGTGTVTVYRLDPGTGTFSAPLASFSTNADFTIPFVADGPTNSLISLGMQANKVSSFHLDMNSGEILKSNGPYQAGSAPEFMAIAHQ
jgi:6-phosphogluconolactonase (cycloisomerase 2 family)